MRPAVDQVSQHYLAFTSLDELKEYLSPITGPKLLVSAHRGGPEPGFPENCIETFENSLRHGPLVIEFDIRQTADDHLIVMHDTTVDRTTNGSGSVGDMTLSEIRELRLKDSEGQLTSFRVPTLEEALAWGKGRAILTLDIKSGVDPDLLVGVVRRLEAETYVTLIVYTIEDAELYSSMAPGWVIAATATSVEAARDLLSLQTPHSDWNVFTGVGRIRNDVLDVLRNAGVRSIMGTFGEIDQRAEAEGPDVYLPLIDAGVGMLATDNVRVASAAARLVNEGAGMTGSAQRFYSLASLAQLLDFAHLPKSGTAGGTAPVELER